MKVQYFAWIKERLRLQEEQVNLKSTTLSDLLSHLCTKGDSYNHIFSNPDKFCISVNNQLIDLAAEPTYVVKEKDEVAFFPPVSGG